MPSLSFPPRTFIRLPIWAIRLLPTLRHQIHFFWSKWIKGTVVEIRHMPWSVHLTCSAKLCQPRYVLAYLMPKQGTRSWPKHLRPRSNKVAIKRIERRWALCPRWSVDLQCVLSEIMSCSFLKVYLKFVKGSVYFKLIILKTDTHTHIFNDI